ncbi:TPR-like protein [Serendipita vermifera]|nr:TPR-like protein [Serendipita vermifera]
MPTARSSCLLGLPSILDFSLNDTDMVYRPFFRHLLGPITATTILFLWGPSLPWNIRIIVTIASFLIVDLVSLLTLQRRSNSLFTSSKISDLKRNELGFKELSAGENPVVDIVAIHGFGGHSERSWTAANGTMWLRDLLPLDIPNARILTYGYDLDTRSFTSTSIQSIFRHAEAFVAGLTEVRSENRERPIIFLAHSLGGIILKKALALCQVADYGSDRRCIKVSTHAILFFGTPHSGANGVDLARWMAKLLSIYMFTDDTTLKELDRDSIELENIQTFYLHASKRIKSINFYETYPTSTMNGVAELIVPRRLGIIQGDRDAIMAPLHADHCEIVKFLDKDDNNYRKVVSYLSKVVEEAPTEVERNWNEEKHHKNIDNEEVQSLPHSNPLKARFPVSRNYIRRPDIENFITERLLGSKSPGIQPRCVLHGLGGSGKTQVASFWVEANKDRFHPIIFIDASSQKQVEADLETAIRSVGPEWSEATWEDAVSYLSKKTGWLLFFDNADTSDLRLEDYLPDSAYGAVLITTRNRDYASYAPDSHIQVGEMSEMEAVDLLHNVANIHPSSHDTSVAIVRELGMLALAVTQAGAYIFKTRQPDRYLGILQKHRAELMREASLKGRNYGESTYTAFNLSFGLLPERAQEFMKICAFLHHSHIPQALFEKSINNQFRSDGDIEDYTPMPETDALISSLESIFGSEWDDFVFQKLIEPILQHSLIDGFTDQNEQTFYNVHPLVQRYIQDFVIPTDQDRYALSAGQLLVAGVRRSEHDNKWDRQLLPHIDNLPTRVKEAHISYAQAFANVYESTGRWNASVVLWKYCDIQVIGEFGERDPRALSIRSRLGSALAECGEWREAEKIEREVLELSKEILGPLHPDTITAMNNLASTLHVRGQLEDAEHMKREVLELRKEILGSRHPNTIAAMHNLASTLVDRGQLEEAEKIQQEVLELLCEVLGPRHPDTIRARNSLASTLGQRGRLEEAERVQRDVLQLRREILGPQHPDTIATMENLASTLHEYGQLEEAEGIQREVLELRRQILGPRHPDTILALNNLAYTLGNLGQLEEAEKIQREVLELQSVILGPGHPYTVLALNNLASTLSNRGQLEEAEKIQREVLELRRDILGPRHPDTIATMNNLAYTLGHCGQQEEAETIQREVLELSKEILGPRHPSTIVTMHNLAYTLSQRSQLEEAEKIQREVLGLWKKTLGPQHPHTTRAMENIAKILRMRGHPEEAEKLEQDAVIMKGSP